MVPCDYLKMACTSLEEFVHVHQPQLKAIGFPSNLVSDLYEELSSERRKEPKDYFSIKKVANSRPTLITKKPLTKHGSFFIVNHIWTNDGGSKCLTHLKKSPDLAEKVSSLFNIPQLQDANDYFCLDAQADVVKFVTKCSHERAKKAVQKYNGCTIETTQSVLDNADGEEDKSLSKNTATVGDISFEEFKEGLKANGDMPENATEQFLYKMYHNFCRQRDGSGTTRAYNWEDEDDVVTVYVPIPINANKKAVKSTLSRTRWSLTVDGKLLLDGDLHAGVKTDDSYWSIESPGLLCMTLDKILQNTWTELLQGEEKLSGDTIVKIGWAKRKCEDLYYNDILDTMWKYNQTYSLASPDSQAKIPQWYIMDEFGSALVHSDYPNFKCSPFFYSVLGRAYSLIWPIKDVQVGIECSRNFIQQIHAQETMEMCNLRLKAYTDNRVANKVTTNDIEPVDKSEEVAVKKIPETPFERSNQLSKVYLGQFSECVDADTTKSLHVTLSSDSLDDSTVAFIPLKDSKISVAGESLPSADVFQNKDYLQSYLLFRFGRPSWFHFNYILPVDLVDFNKEYEMFDTPQYWLVKPVDKAITQFETFVTSQYTRIVRMCETGSIAVSKFVDTLLWRNRVTTLSYPVVLNMSTKNVYVYTEPVFRVAKSAFNPDDLINEYDNNATITNSKPDLPIVYQAEETMDEFKVQMNKLLLQRDPDKGWAYIETRVFQILGKLGKGMVTDLSWSSESQVKNTYVLFNAELIIGSDLNPCIVDIFGSAILPNKSSLEDILKTGLGSERPTFMKI